MEGLTRGDLVTVALTGDYGKPRPALVIQSELFDNHPSVTLLPVTNTLVDAPLLRLTVEPDPDVLLAVGRHLAIFLGIAK